ncbi:hypothetical protein RI129_008821 [Pyrocoelia pectoralis]|uniref:Jouberin n=1 Tax=Pyrocoelia pectoralis TaxID=417401 RepID=A0AAN7VAJ2_9COLE
MKGKNEKNIANMVQKVNSNSFSSSENLVQEVIEVDVHENADDNNFILNKFLNDANSLMSKNAKTKPPIPLPRKSKKIPQDTSCMSSVDDSSTIQSEKTQPSDSSSSGSLKLKLQSSQDTAILIESNDDTQITVEKLEKIELQEMATDEIDCDNATQHGQLGPLKSTSKVGEKVIYNYCKLMAITIHKTERLLLNSLVVHPLVKIHIVEMSTGNYILKSDISRSVIFYYENKNINYITPLLSEPYDLYKNHCAHPEWEETLLINEDITYILERNVIIFFEIIDFVSFSVANSQTKAEEQKGWHKIAWAFLKPLGKNGELNVNKKVHLQLYQSYKYKKVPPNVCPMFHWWKSKKLVRYPSSLYVSVCEIEPPEGSSKTLRSRTPMQPEKASLEILETDRGPLSHSSPLPTELNNVTRKQDVKLWSRLSYQTCKLPNRCIAELPTFTDGCFFIKFSHSGLYLACAVQIDMVHFILCRYSAHQGLIYNINWSADDLYIITSSADCTVGIWNFIKRSFIEMLPHPCYVYASDVNKNNTIATGCYDYTVRLWCLSNDETYDLLQELDGHKGYITSLCFACKHYCLYSSDSVGVVIEWKRGDDPQHSWKLSREYKWIDLKDTIINQILLHKRERRLLIHARDSTLRMVDLKTGCTLQWLQGATNNRFRTVCSFSACGTYVFAGGEYGTISVWNADLGNLVASYEPYLSFNNQTVTIHCVQFHPHDNILAIAHYGHNVPILLAVYDISICGDNNLGLKIVQRDDEVRSTACRQILGSTNNSEVQKDLWKWTMKQEGEIELSLKMLWKK